MRESERIGIHVSCEKRLKSPFDTQCEIAISVIVSQSEDTSW